MVSGRRSILTGLACVAVACAAMAAIPPLPPAAAQSPLAQAMQQALADLEAGRYAHAEREALKIAIGDEPGAGRAWLVVAAARQRLGRHNDALAAWRAFLPLCTSQTEREFTLRQIRRHQQAGIPPQPLVAPSRSLSAATLAELAVVEEAFSVEYSPHFVVRARNPRLAKLLSVEAERALARICGVLLGGQAFPHVVEVYVWPDLEEYRRHAIDSPEWSGGSYSARSTHGIMERRIDLTQLDAHGRFHAVMLDRILPHELCHLVVDDFFGDAPQPLFLAEGLAMLAEREVDNDRVLLAGTALAGPAALPLETMLIRHRMNLRQDMALFYAQSFSFVEFLHSRMDRTQFRDFLEHVKSGCTVSEAVQRALYAPYDPDFLARLAGSWEQYAITQAQYLLALQGDLARAD